MKEYCFNNFKTSIRVTLLNFDELPRNNLLEPVGRRKQFETDILLYKYKMQSKNRDVKNKISGNKQLKAHFNRNFCEVINFDKRKMFCCFKNGLSLDFIVSRQVERSFLLFQMELGILFVHASSVVIDGKLNLFVAPSGGGKTTFYNLAKAHGLNALDEEVCIVKRKGNKFYAGIFPFYDPLRRRNPFFELENIFFLEKSAENSLRKITKVEAIRRAMPEASTFFRNQIPRDRIGEYRSHVFNFLDALFENVDFNVLNFNKSPKVFSCLK
ncbi:MAG: hypothetical protein PHW46_06590 [Candidatus Omnitrophica bacterium]|nr:hypothetical protein [Candidatus Omnitrophota bacterium]